MATIRATTRDKAPEELQALFAQIIEETAGGAVFVVLRVDEPEVREQVKGRPRNTRFIRVAWTFRAEGDGWSDAKGTQSKF